LFEPHTVNLHKPNFFLSSSWKSVIFSATVLSVHYTESRCKTGLILWYHGAIPYCLDKLWRQKPFVKNTFSWIKFTLYAGSAEFICSLPSIIYQTLNVWNIIIKHNKINAKFYTWK
jgi:hypothetical protein